MTDESAAADNQLPSSVKWSWALRRLNADEVTLRHSTEAPRAGDVALVRVEEVGHHTKIVTADNRHLRLYAGDHVGAVFGNRYATDAFEGEVLGLEELSLLTGCGMIGTIRSAHADTDIPTRVRFLGYIASSSGDPINLKERLFHAPSEGEGRGDLVLVVGTSMNAGKTTVAAQLVRGLVLQGLRVAACKLTGSVSNRDQDSLRAASPSTVLDFSDYGFPSTYLAEPGELRRLFDAIVADAARAMPDVTVMEIADGVIQRETNLILTDPNIRRRVTGVVLAARDSLSGLFALRRLRRLGYPVLAASGRMTSSPLMVREFQTRATTVPVISSVEDLPDLATALLPRLAAAHPSQGAGLIETVPSGASSAPAEELRSVGNGLPSPTAGH